MFALAFKGILHSSYKAFNIFNKRSYVLGYVIKSCFFRLLTVLAVVAMFAQWTEAEVSAARKLYAGSTVLARVVLAHGYLAGGSHVTSGALALPLLRLLAVLVQIVGFDLYAGGAIATRTR